MTDIHNKILLSFFLTVKVYYTTEDDQLLTVHRKQYKESILIKSFRLSFVVFELEVLKKILFNNVGLSSGFKM
jgi:hypothetical protein